MLKIKITHSLYITKTSPTIKNLILVVCRVLLAIVVFQALMVYLDQRWGYPIHVDIHVGGGPKGAIVQNGDLALVHMASDPEKSQTQMPSLIPIPSCAISEL